MSRQNPGEYEVYRHFKGTLYQIVTMAVYAETGGEMVIYRSLYEPSKVYAEPLAMFMSEVDSTEYPNTVQRYRFERQTETDASASEENGSLETEKECRETEVCVDEGQEEEMEADLAARLGVNPLLLEFLDADTYGSKLNLLTGMRDKVDDRMLNAIAMSLDLELGKETLEEKYEEVKNCLVMMEKYECSRLR